MKKLILCLLILFSAFLESKSQVVDAKVNILSGCIGIYNPSIEIGFNKSSALSFDYVGIFGKENFLGTGYPCMLNMVLFGYRHYLKKDIHKGFFASADFGLDMFRMNKNIIPLFPHDHSNEGYDVGSSWMAGISLGYKHKFNYRWGMEASLSYGFHHAQHEGYTEEGVRLFELNASAEWVPYKAGIYLTYRIGKKN